MKNFSSEKIKMRQRKFFLIFVGGCMGLAFLIFSWISEPQEKPNLKPDCREETSFNLVSQEVDPKIVRISALENLNDALNGRMDSLESSLEELHEESSEIEASQQILVEETRALSEHLRLLEEELSKKNEQTEIETEHLSKNFKAWGENTEKNGRHVSFEIPAGTVVKAVLISGADCSVAVQKPTGPNMVLLRPLDHGSLPRNVRVPLKGSIIIGNAIGDISSERVYIRAERMSLVDRRGSFIETELSAYVSGEDGREGMRGVVVDRSGQIVARAAFAALLQGIGSGAEAALNAKAFDGLTEKHPSFEMLRYGPLQGGTTALNKMTDYYIKRAEQLQPAIQIAAGRVVDLIFTRTVKIGEKNLKKKFNMERAAQRSSYE